MKYELNLVNTPFIRSIKSTKLKSRNLCPSQGSIDNNDPENV